MIIVTGGAGFIGSNIIKTLNNRQISDILVVDDFTDGKKFENLVDCEFTDYIDKEDLLSLVENNALEINVEVIFHQGACSDTGEWNGKYLMKNNYEYSKKLLHYSVDQKIPFIYASSAAVYGHHQTFVEEPCYERPINMYGYSKFAFDHYVRQWLPEVESPIVGLRYFNVYGPREAHKNAMASVAFHHYQQLQSTQKVKLFEGSGGYGPGEQRRDFIYVQDVADVNLWMWQHPTVSGIFNVGTGKSQPFNDIANSVIAYFGKGEIEYVPFPEKLRDHYQSFTQANIDKLRAVGYSAPFKTVQEGVREYMEWLEG